MDRLTPLSLWNDFILEIICSEIFVWRGYSHSSFLLTGGYHGMLFSPIFSLMFNLFLSINLNCISFRQYVVLVMLFYPVWQTLYFNWMFQPCTLNTIFDLSCLLSYCLFCMYPICSLFHFNSFHAFLVWMFSNIQFYVLFWPILCFAILVVALGFIVYICNLSQSSCKWY